MMIQNEQNKGKGELVYVPGSVALTDNSPTSEASSIHITSEPGLFLVVEKAGSDLGILVNGAVWYVQKSDCFTVGEQKW